MHQNRDSSLRSRLNQMYSVPNNERNRRITLREQEDLDKLLKDMIEELERHPFSTSSRSFNHHELNHRRQLHQHHNNNNINNIQKQQSNDQMYATIPSKSQDPTNRYTSSRQQQQLRQQQLQQQQQQRQDDTATTTRGRRMVFEPVVPQHPVYELRMDQVQPNQRPIPSPVAVPVAKPIMPLAVYTARNHSPSIIQQTSPHTSIGSHHPQQVIYNNHQNNNNHTYRQQQQQNYSHLQQHQMPQHRRSRSMQSYHPLSPPTSPAPPVTRTTANPMTPQPHHRQQHQHQQQRQQPQYPNHNNITTNAATTIASQSHYSRSDSPSSRIPVSNHHQLNRSRSMHSYRNTSSPTSPTQDQRMPAHLLNRQVIYDTPPDSKPFNYGVTAASPLIQRRRVWNESTAYVSENRPETPISEFMLSNGRTSGTPTPGMGMKNNMGNNRSAASSHHGGDDDDDDVVVSDVADIMNGHNNNDHEQQLRVYNGVRDVGPPASEDLERHRLLNLPHAVRRDLATALMHSLYQPNDPTANPNSSSSNNKKQD